MRNVGKLDQAARIAIGLGMFSMIWLAPESGYWGLLGIAPLITGVMGYCPGYRLLGIRTRAPE